jgi:hypothetical protein
LRSDVPQRKIHLEKPPQSLPALPRANAFRRCEAATPSRRARHNANDQQRACIAGLNTQSGCRGQNRDRRPSGKRWQARASVRLALIILAIPRPSRVVRATLRRPTEDAVDGAPDRPGNAG